jgi:Pyruvate/2-oxoacid:ferredoxin oxidoreductase delta subunit
MALFGKRKESAQAGKASVSASKASAPRGAGAAAPLDDGAGHAASGGEAGSDGLLDSLPEDYGDQAETARKKMRKVVIVKQYCTHAAGSDCERCLLCCPHDAITLEEGKAPKVDDALCTGCGICFGVCDAFGSTRLTLHDLHARLQRIATSGRRAYLTCKENVFPDMNPDTNVVVLPCLSMMSPEMFTLLLSENIRLTVACDLSYCEDCTRGGALGGSLFPRAIQIAEERTGEKVLFSFRIPERQTLVEKYADDDPLGRREAFSGFVGDFAEIASGKRRLRNSTVLQDYYVKKEQQRAAALVNLADESAFDNFRPAGGVRKVLHPRKKMVLEAVQRRPDIAGNIPVAVSTTDPDACCQAHDCIEACTTGARALEDGMLAFDARLCIGCGICVDACEHAACSVEETTAEIYVDGAAAEQQ